MLRESTELHLIDKCQILSETYSDGNVHMIGNGEVDFEMKEKIMLRKLELIIDDPDKLLDFLGENWKSLC